MPKVNPRNKVGPIFHTVSNKFLSNHTPKNIHGNVNYAKTFLQGTVLNVFDRRTPGGKNAIWKLNVDFEMPSNEPTLGVKFMNSIAPSGRFWLMNSINWPALVPDPIAFASPLPHRCLAVTLPSPHPSFCPPSSSSRPLSTRTRMATATAIATSVVVVIIPFCAAATTDAVLPVAASTAAVTAALRPHLGRCR
jgi:hypothetical protein